MKICQRFSTQFKALTEHPAINQQLYRPSRLAILDDIPLNDSQFNHHPLLRWYLFDTKRPTLIHKLTGHVSLLLGITREELAVQPAKLSVQVDVQLSRENLSFMVQNANSVRVGDVLDAAAQQLRASKVLFRRCCISGPFCITGQGKSCATTTHSRGAVQLS